MKNLLLIDGHNFLFKAYAVQFKFHSKKGTPLHVVTVFLSLLRRAVQILEERGGCHMVAVVFDADGRNSNHALSEEYKANRKDYSKLDDSPFHHLPYVRQALGQLGIKMYEKKGIEADDVIASLTTQFLKIHRNGKVFIASSDSDFYQILSKRVFQIIISKNSKILGPEYVSEKLFIAPKQYVYWKSLVGDKADNIAGVPGVGPLRAAGIINKTFKLDLVRHKELLAKNRLLIRLNVKLNVCKNWKPLLVSAKRIGKRNGEIFSALGF